MLATDVTAFESKVSIHVTHILSSCIRLFLNTKGCTCLWYILPLRSDRNEAFEQLTNTLKRAQSWKCMIHVAIFQNLNAIRLIRQPRFQNDIFPLMQSLRQPIGMTESGTHWAAQTIDSTQRREQWWVSVFESNGYGAVTVRASYLLIACSAWAHSSV